jgi:hypothetical protein
VCGGTGTCELILYPPIVDGCVTRFACEENQRCRPLTGQPCRDFNGCLSWQCRGGVCASNPLVLSPELVDFGTLAAGQEATAEYTVRNDALAPADPFEIALLPIGGTDAFTVLPTTCGTTTLAARGGTCKFTVRFRPAAGRIQHLATIELHRQVVATAILTRVSLGGAWTEDVARLSPNWNDFDVVPFDGVSGSLRTITIANPSNGSPITAVKIVGRDPGDFTIVAASLPLPLAAGRHIDVDVRFVPRSAGPHAARLEAVSSKGTGAAGLYGFSLLPIPRLTWKGASSRLPRFSTQKRARVAATPAVRVPKSYCSGLKHSVQAQSPSRQLPSRQSPSPAQRWFHDFLQTPAPSHG